MARHLLAAFQAYDAHPLRAQTKDRARCVQSHTAASEDDHVLADGHRSFETNVAQHIDPYQRPFQIGPREGQLAPLVCASGDQDGVIPFIEKLIHAGYTMVQTQVHAQVDNVLYFALRDPGGQSKFWHGYAEHASGYGQSLVHRHPIPHRDQVLRAGQSCGTRTDDGDALIARVRQRLNGLAWL